MEPVIHPINVLVEGDVDEMIVRRVLDYAGLTCGIVYGKEGKGSLLRRLSNYNQAARFTPWLAVVDLDRDEECAPPFIDRVLPDQAFLMHFRVAVRAIESWVMADAEHLAAFLSIRAALIPANPDAEPDPKTTLINLARRSRRRAIRDAIVPRERSGCRAGPGYTGRLIEFIVAPEHPWRPDVACQRSDSLRRCMEALLRYRSLPPILPTHSD